MPELRIPRLYLSGRFTTDTKIESAWLKITGNKYRCFSFANVVPGQMWYNDGVKAALKVCEEKKVGIMMDSGAHSLHKLASASKRRNTRASEKQAVNIEQVKDAMFKEYVKLCTKRKKLWNFYVTLDFIRHQPSIYAMQLRFEKEGLKPVPVYHGDHELDWVLKYVDRGYDLIGVGNSKDFRKGYKGYRYYLDRLFDLGAKHNIRYHGLAVTSLSLMTMYDWWSADSSTWSKVATFGCLTFPDRDRNIIYNLHVSKRKSNGGVTSFNNLPRRQKEMITEVIKDLGFDLAPMREIDGGETHRHTFNGFVFSNLDKLGVDFTKQREKVVKWEPLF